MKPENFKQYNIVNFSTEEIEATGAELKDVRLQTIQTLQNYRGLVGRRVKFVNNGITTGKHKSPEHLNGLAVDVYHVPADGEVDWKRSVYLALESGFKGIGVYFNYETKLYTFHFDLGKFRMWCGYKYRRFEKWNYRSLLNDPKDYIIV